MHNVCQPLSRIRGRPPLQGLVDLSGWCNYWDETIFSARRWSMCKARILLTQTRTNNPMVNQPLLKSTIVLLRAIITLRSRMFAIYLIMLGSKTFVNRMLLWNRPTPQPKANPTQEKWGQKKGASWATFSHSEVGFRGLGLILYIKQTARNPTQPNCSPLRLAQCASTICSNTTMYVNISTVCIEY